MICSTNFVVFQQKNWEFWFHSVNSNNFDNFGFSPQYLYFKIGKKKPPHG
jgi:hypothetical protein